MSTHLPDMKTLADMVAAARDAGFNVAEVRQRGNRIEVVLEDGTTFFVKPPRQFKTLEQEQ